MEKEKPFNFAEQMLALGKTDEFLSKLKNLDRDEQIQFLYHRILNRKADPMGLTGYRKLFEEKDTIRILMECLVYSGEFREHLKRLPFAEESVDLSNKGAASPAAAADVSKALSVIKSAEKSNKNARRDRPLHTHDEHGHLK